ncbi:MAG: DUF971 domain-containing protein [Planctomycetia bacterium]|nr:DUF971 domain-containing protein [Planctomycetia bacterium]
MSMPRPEKLELVGPQLLRITWNDGHARTYSVRELRDACPCATCREKRLQAPAAAPLFPVLTAAETQPLRLLGMDPVGDYAYSLQFSDGHDTGIFTLEHLRELGVEVSA